MIPIKYVIGDVTYPQGKGRKIIAHSCNDYGGWGKGFVLALSARASEPEESYRRWYELADPIGICDVPFELGEFKLVPFCGEAPPNETYVANMITQRGSRVDYVSLNQCLNKLRKVALEVVASIHMPRIGCGLGGGKWSEVEDIIKRTLCAWNVDTTIYDLEHEKDKFRG